MGHWAGKNRMTAADKLLDWISRKLTAHLTTLLYDREAGDRGRFQLQGFNLGNGDQPICVPEKGHKLELRAGRLRFEMALLLRLLP